MLRRLLDRLAGWPRADLALLGLSAALLLAAGLRAVRAADPAPGASAVPIEAPAFARIEDALPHIAPEALMAAVFTDPFRADRTAPEQRYRLSGADPPESRRSRRERTPIPGYRLRGTAILGELRLAMIDGSTARRGLHVYRLGETIDAFRLTAIAADSAVLADADTTLVLKILRPWKK